MSRMLRAGGEALSMATTMATAHRRVVATDGGEPARAIKIGARPGSPAAGTERRRTTRHRAHTGRHSAAGRASWTC